MMNLLNRLASLKLTLAILVLLCAGIVYSYNSRINTTAALVGPLFLFALNLAAAVMTNPMFRRQTALLVFHLALIAIILLMAAGRLTYLKGKLELAEGIPYDGQLIEYESGPLHRWRLDRVHFLNEGFSIEYDVGLQRGKTRNRLRWLDENGDERSGIIGDNDPLVLYGYRFYTSPNKGFAPIFTWYPERGGGPVRGAVHLPSYPVNQYKQAREWMPAGSSRKIWTMLQFDEVVLDPEKPAQFRLPKEYKLIVRVGEDRRELRPGERYELKDGTLVYEGLRSWMGYTVFSDWTIPWLLAACVVAVLSLAWHFREKFAAKPWLETS